MPLPPTPVTIQGGCNCRAIRYKIDLPALSDRPVHFADGPAEQQDPVRLPFIATDHCNDCRRATGSVLPCWICAPISMVSAACLSRSALTDPDTSSVASEDTQWRPAVDLFQPGIASRDTFLTFYQSSPGRRRSFCGRCGTNIAYAIFPTPEGWTEMLDLVLGTVDRKDLEDQELSPERQLWWDYGINWIQNLTKEGANRLPKHPTYKVGEVVQ